MLQIFTKLALLLSSATLAPGFGFGVSPRTSSSVSPTALEFSIFTATPPSSLCQSPNASGGQWQRTAAAGYRHHVSPKIMATATATTDSPSALQTDQRATRRLPWQEGGTTGMKVIKSAGVALAWFIASSAAAVAVSSATGGAVIARPPRRKYTGLPILLIAYALSRKEVKQRTRLEGVVPRDPESIKLLADEAEDLAMSWGKPAGLMAYTSVDSITFAFFSRLVGFPFKELFSAQRVVNFQNPELWISTVLASAFGYAIVTWSRRVGQGYLRSVCASALSPAMHRLVVRPAKAVASVAGMGDGWDLGLTDDERKARPPSIELRKSLSTFKDPDFHGDGSIGDTGGAAYPPPPPPPPTELGLGDVNHDGAPPDLKRSS